jgi:hypothetical protein
MLAMISLIPGLPIIFSSAPMTAELPQMSAPATITRVFLNFEFMDAALLCWRGKIKSACGTNSHFG